MMAALENKYVKLVLIAGVVIILDQITKAIILNTMPLHDSIPVIDGFFNITHIHNRGGAFGIFAGASSGVRTILFLVISTFAAFFVLYFYSTLPKSHKFLAFGFALIFGGAVGNLIDRIRFGEVVDFLDFYIGNSHYPAFNVADSAITIGITILFFHIVFNKLPE